MGVRKLNFGIPLVVRKTVWVYRVFWAKIETKPQKKIHTRLKQSFLFIYLFIIIIIILLLLLFRQSKKKTKEKTYLFFYTFFWKKQIIIIYSIIYLARWNWVLTISKVDNSQKIGGKMPYMPRFLRPEAKKMANISKMRLGVWCLDSGGRKTCAKNTFCLG